MIIITGPTACGKTSTAVALAKMINGEIISADSMQVYKGMDIGTAKPTLKERDGIPHHLIDIADPTENFSVAIYQKMARNSIEEIRKRGKTPILVGGTGFYINATIFEQSIAPEENNSNLNEIAEQLMQESEIELHNRLKEVDPKSAESIHPNNKKRVVRALAYYEANGKPISAHIRGKKQLYNAPLVILHRDRASLYDAINKRVDEMISQGLAEEVKALLSAGVQEKATAMQAIGYKEMIPYIKGETTLENGITAIKHSSRRYAKRQLTWFRHQMDGNRLSMDGITTKEAAKNINDIFWKPSDR